ncbi:MAG: ferritin family protein [Spirochaetes bacterium]|nr:ferritin family protein [Spirochaetota bacterium]
MEYTIKEIIDIAVGIEETGHDLYSAAAKKFKDHGISDVFDFLAGEELAHKKLFQTFMDRDDEKGAFTEEYFAYLKAIGAPRVFEGSRKDTDALLRGMATPMEVIQFAFSAEKESILLYTEMKELYREGGDTRSLLDKIISEEKKHVLTLLDLAEKTGLAK